MEFQDNSKECKSAIDLAIEKFLKEVGGEIQSEAQRNTRPDAEGLKESWDYITSEYKVSIGSPLEMALWEEFGTGSHAEHGDGRKGWWVYVKGSDGSKTGKDYYTFEEAVSTCNYLRSKGLDAYYTDGKDPNHTLQRAFDTKKNSIEARAKEIFGEIIK